MTEFKPAEACNGIEPFQVMVLLDRAQQLAASGRDIVHMEAGEPDFSTPAPIIAAAQAALELGDTRYTGGLGMWPLREAISARYQSQYGLEIPASRIAITAGGTGALQLALRANLNPGDEVLIPDPGYPCNRHQVSLLGGKPRLLAATAESGFAMSAEQVRTAWTDTTRMLMLASPANPTGAVLNRDQLASLSGVVREKAGLLVVDEIYHGLNYSSADVSALTIEDSAWVINGFSKYYGMTGWRLGWLVAPEAAMPILERLAQNLFLAPSTIAQHAAMAAFTPETLAICEQRRIEFSQRRDRLVQGLRELGFGIPQAPEGAFYVYVDASTFTQDALGFCLQLLEDTGVSVTPGVDFGDHRAAEHLRFSYTTSMARIDVGLERLGSWLSANRNT